MTTFPTRHALAALFALFLVACGGDDADTDTELDEQAPTIELRDLEPGETCEFGGIEVRSGVDANNDALIDDDELDFSRAVCNGANGTDGENGTDGTNGEDGTNGTDGTNGQDGRPLDIVTAPITAGDVCTNGGTLFTFGYDDDNDDALTGDEIVDTVEVCNGVDGTNGEDGTNGTDGTDGTDGQDALPLIVETAPITAGDVCTNGGTLVTFGYDENDDNALTGDEIVDTVEVCNGRDGVDGTDGTNGQDGLTSLMELETLEVGNAVCAAGGVRLRVGFDTSGDGNVDDTSSTREICNGADGTNGQDGTDGTNGQDGTDGLPALVETSPLAIGDTNCPNGGVQVVFGYDTTGDDNIDQISSTESVCNGLDGEDGEQGPTGPTGPAGQDGQDATGGGGATLVDSNGNTLGLVIGSSDADISVLTSEGYRVTLTWNGDFTNATTLEFSGSNCTGTVYLSYYNQENLQIWGRSVFYNPNNGQVLLAAPSSIGADGIIDPSPTTVASYLEASGSCTNLSPAETSPTAPLVSTSATDVGLPATIAGPLSIE